VSTPPRVDPSWPVLTTDWTAQLSSLLMGTKTPFMIQSIDGLGLPLARSVDVPRAGADGSFSGQDFANSRDVTLIMDVVPGSGQTVAGLISAFTQAWAARTVDVGLSLCIPGWGPIVLIGRPRKGDASFDLVAGRGTLIALQALFTAVDPRKYGATLKSVQANYPTSGVGTGLAFNAASYRGAIFNTGSYRGATFGPTAAGASSTGLQYCTNAGSQSTAPFTRIVAGGGSVTGPIHLERVESGEEIELNINLNPGDLLELDHDLHSVTLNGTSNRSDVVDHSSQWWWLRPGLNTIRFQSEGPGVGSYAQISWRDAFW
jgi:hypothetical protein